MSDSRFMYFCLLTIGAATIVSVESAVPSNHAGDCDEGHLARCLSPLQPVLWGVLTKSWAFDITKLQIHADQICRVFKPAVDRCPESVINTCSQSPRGPYSGILVTLLSFCDTGRSVLDDFPCLADDSFLEAIERCQIEAGLHSPAYDQICQGAAMMRVCVGRAVISECDMLAVERYENLSETLLTPLRLNYGCSLDPDPFRVIARPQPRDCLSRVHVCQRHLIALRDTKEKPYSVTALLTLKTPICRSYEQALDCLYLVDRCSHVTMKEMAPYWFLSDYCSVNTSNVLNHECLYRPPVLQAMRACEELHHQVNPDLVNFCSHFSEMGSCMEEVLVAECGNEHQSSLQAYINTALEHQNKPCLPVMAAIREYPCIINKVLMGSLDNCQRDSGLLSLNRSTECSKIPEFIQCAETAISTTCSENNSTEIVPIVHRFTSLVSENTDCSLDGQKRPLSVDVSVKNGVGYFDWSDTDPTNALLENGGFFSKITPMNIAIGFVLLCILFAFVAIITAYCNIKNYNKKTNKSFKPKNDKMYSFNVTQEGASQEVLADEIASLESGNLGYGNDENKPEKIEESSAKDYYGHQEEDYVVEECTQDTSIHF